MESYPNYPINDQIPSNQSLKNKVLAQMKARSDNYLSNRPSLSQYIQDAEEKQRMNTAKQIAIEESQKPFNIIAGSKVAANAMKNILEPGFDAAMLIEGGGLAKNAIKSGLKSMSKKVAADEIASNIAASYGRTSEGNKKYFLKQFTDSEGNAGKTIPWNRETNASMQQEYVDNLKNYYNSAGFKNIMKKHYPDVDLNQYVNKTLDNLKKEAIYSPEPTSIGAGGTYTPKQYLVNDRVRLGNPTFKTKVIDANENKFLDEKTGISKVADLGSLQHELNHQRTNADELLPDYLTKNHLQENLKKGNFTDKELSEFKNYYSNPTEFEVRSRIMKEDLKNAGIVDYFKTDEITPEHINKLLEISHEPSAEFKEFAKIHKKWKAGEVPNKDYYEAKIKFQNSDDANQNNYMTKDSHELLRYFTPEFLSKNLNKLPLVGAAIGTSKLNSMKKNEK